MPDRPMKIRCVLWDMDGTLLDSEKVYNLCCASYASSRGYPFLDETYFAEYCGVSPERTGRMMREDFSRRGIDLDPAEVEKHRISGYLEWIRAHGAPVFPGVYRVMGKLGAMGIRQAVCTSSAYEDAHISLEMAGLMPKLDTVVYGTDIRNPKPAPDIFLHAAGILGMEPGECLVVEDSLSGLKAAERAGMQLCFKGNGSFRDREIRLISSPEEILSLFEGAENGC